MIDESPGGCELQLNLYNNFAPFEDLLGNGATPDLHLGVVTSDLHAAAMIDRALRA